MARSTMACSRFDRLSWELMSMEVSYSADFPLTAYFNASVITDDNGHLIRSESLDAIGADLELLYDTLEGRDLSAGSPQARRLFS